MDGVPVGTLPRGPLTAAIKAEIEASLATLVPPGRRGALLVVVDPQHGGRLEVGASLDQDGDWKLGASAGVWDGDVSGRVILAGSW